MRKFSLVVLLVLALSLLLAACGGGGSEPASDSAAVAPRSGGNAANGEKLYKQPVIGKNSAPGCNTCHSLDEGVVLVGPSHAGMGTRAATAVSGQSAEDYLRESITNPNAHVTEGYAQGVMYQNYGTDLTEQEINDLVAFLMSQK